jgi:chaperonin cofactor prefoldin
MSNNNDHGNVTPEPKRFRKYTLESDLDTNNMNNLSISDSKSDAPTTGGTSQNGHTSVIFQTTEDQSVNLAEIIQQMVISPRFIESIGPIIASADKNSLDDAMKNYVSTLETKVKRQDEEINNLKESNEELSDSNRMMSSRIDTLGKQLESDQQYGRRNSLRFHNVPMKLDNIQDTAGLVLKVSRDHLGVEL